MSWNYAELSKAAKAAGGPELYALMLKEGGRLLGHAEMYPWIGIVGGGGLLIGGGVVWLIGWGKKKKEIAKAMTEEGTEGFIRTMHELGETTEDDSPDDDTSEPDQASAPPAGEP